MKKMAVFLLVSIIICAVCGPSRVNKVNASSTIYIRSSGVVEGTDSILRNGSLYTFTENINDHIIIEKDNITIDGAGLTLQGDWNEAGLNITNLNNVTIQNLNILNFNFGIYIYSSKNITIFRNRINENGRDGIRMTSSSQNVISENNITNNSFYGVYLNSSSFNTISKNNITSNYYGTWFTLSSHNSILENNILDSQEYGFWLRESTDNTISDNEIARNNVGLYLSSSSHNNSILGNGLSSNGYGLRIRESRNNNVAENNMMGNDDYGLYLQESFNTILRNVTLSNNNVNFAVVGLGLSDFILDIDASNTVEAKPIYYIVNDQDTEVPFDAGYVALVNSTRITVKGLKLQQNGQGILLVHTTNSKIRYNDITDNEVGIQLHSSSNNSFYGNNIMNNRVYGLVAISSSDNRICQNNFINNVNHVFISSGESNVWNFDYPVGGNYWDTFTGSDKYRGPYQNQTGSDGFSDTMNTIDANNQDGFPLIGPINFFDAGTWNDTAYFVSVISNSTLSAFYFNPAEIEKNFRFNTTGLEGSVGFCRVAFPEIFLKGPYTVTVDEEPVRISAGTNNETHVFLYFTFNHSTKIVKVIGTEAIPEFPPSAILLLVLFMTLLTLSGFKMKKKRLSLN